MDFLKFFSVSFFNYSDPHISTYFTGLLTVHNRAKKSSFVLVVQFKLLLPYNHSYYDFEILISHCIVRYAVRFDCYIEDGHLVILIYVSRHHDVTINLRAFRDDLIKIIIFTIVVLKVHLQVQLTVLH